MIVDTALAAATLLRPVFAEAGGERFAALHLDRDRTLLGMDQGGIGSAGAVELPVRRIIARSLALDGAGLVVAHNHPSGDPNPSREDIEATRRLADAAAALDIRLHDHLVFAAGSFRSFRELGLL